MLKFYTLKEKEPNDCSYVLIKSKQRPIINRKTGETSPFYYVVIPYKNQQGKWTFEEAAGEQWSTWSEDEILGWCPLQAIENNEIW